MNGIVFKRVLMFIHGLMHPKINTYCHLHSFRDVFHIDKEETHLEDMFVTYTQEFFEF